MIFLKPCLSKNECVPISEREPLNIVLLGHGLSSDAIMYRQYRIWFCGTQYDIILKR